MSVQHHLDALKRRHQSIDAQIQEGYSNYVADQELTKMKQEKLIIKQQIEQIENDMK
jgi:hypothetical protein